MQGYFGIIGGMGTVASTVFLNLLNRIHRPLTDQDHLNYIVWNNSDVPDRTDYILNPHLYPSPLPVLKEAVLSLEKMGVSFIAIPCNTAHYFYKELSAISSVPILDMIDLVGQYLVEQNISRVGLMATSGTIQAGIYNEISEKYSIELMLPDAIVEKNIMTLIYDNVKSSQKTDVASYNELMDYFLLQGAEAVILGCTELSVIEHTKENDHLSQYAVDSQEVLARQVVKLGKQLKSIED